MGVEVEPIFFTECFRKFEAFTHETRGAVYGRLAFLEGNFASLNILTGVDILYSFDGGTRTIEDMRADNSFREKYLLIRGMLTSNVLVLIITSLNRITFETYMGESNWFAETPPVGRGYFGPTGHEFLCYELRNQSFCGNNGMSGPVFLWYRRDLMRRLPTAASFDLVDSRLKELCKGLLSTSTAPCVVFETSSLASAVPVRRGTRLDNTQSPTNLVTDGANTRSRSIRT